MSLALCEAHRDHQEYARLVDPTMLLEQWDV